MYESIPETVMDANKPRSSKLSKVGAMVGGLVLAAGACWYQSGSRTGSKLFSSNFGTIPLTSLYEASAYPSSWQPEGAPDSAAGRTPTEFKKFNVDLFSHPVVKEALASSNTLTQQVCGGPEGNIDVWYNEAAVQKDLQTNEAYTVFDLDCRDSEANPLLAFIIVLDMEGNIAAIHNPPMRAESVNMMSTDVVMFSCIAGAGVYLWNWKEDVVQKMPFPADAHTMQYRHSDNKFFGLYLDEEAMTKFSPSVAMAYSADSGEYSWAFEPEFSHINYMTVNGDYAYISLRSGGCLQKVNMETNEVVWNLGGKYSSFHMVDREGNFLDANKKCRNTFRPSVEETMFGTFQHQHKFQHLSDEYYSLFDNNVCANSAFCNEDSSRMVVLHLDEEQYTAKEVFSFDTGDQSRIYGGADVLPSGNVLGNSYHKAVYPDSEEYKYHVNIWEVQPNGELAWRVGVRGLNPWNPEDVVSPHYHSLAPGEEAPVGWMIYNADRFYSKPVVTAPCVATNEAGAKVVRLLPHNTVRTQENMPGVAYLYNTQSKTLLSKTEFEFQKSWIPTVLEVELPSAAEGATLSMLVANSWQESTMVHLDAEMPACETTQTLEDRLFK